jgi:hypothetical protein
VLLAWHLCCACNCSTHIYIYKVIKVMPQQWSNMQKRRSSYFNNDNIASYIILHILRRPISLSLARSKNSQVTSYLVVSYSHDAYGADARRLGVLLSCLATMYSSTQKLVPPHIYMHVLVWQIMQNRSALRQR